MAKKKISHIYTKEEQEKFIAFALKAGNTSKTTSLLRQKFGLSAPSAYYYRRTAFGYYRGSILPIPLYLSDGCVRQIDAMRGEVERVKFVESMVKEAYQAEQIKSQSQA